MTITRRIHIGELSAAELDHLVDLLWQLADALISLRPNDENDDWPTQEETLSMLDNLAEHQT